MRNDQILDAMIQWETDGLPIDTEVDLFQSLVNNGMAWSLQGMYGRRAMALIDDGLVVKRP